MYDYEAFESSFENINYLVWVQFGLFLHFIFQKYNNLQQTMMGYIRTKDLHDNTQIKQFTINTYNIV